MKRLHLLLLLTLPLSLGWLWWWRSTPPGGPVEPGPPVSRLEGAWVYDAARVADIPPEFRAGVADWAAARITLEGSRLTIDDGRQTRVGTCRITSYPPVFYDVHWEPLGGPPTTLRFGLTPAGVSFSPAAGGALAVPLRRAP